MCLTWHCRSADPLNTWEEIFLLVFLSGKHLSTGYIQSQACQERSVITTWLLVVYGVLSGCFFYYCFHWFELPLLAEQRLGGFGGVGSAQAEEQGNKPFFFFFFFLISDILTFHSGKRTGGNRWSWCELAVQAPATPPGHCAQLKMKNKCTELFLLLQWERLQNWVCIVLYLCS